MRIILLATASVFLMTSFAFANEQVFFADLPDIPVMPGLAEQPTDQLVFENASGRVVEAVAAGQVQDMAAIMRFYAETLPELGWQPYGTGQFVRGAEILKIMPEYAVAGGVRIKVALAPKP